jgi:ribose transport system substrate-binding protein
MKRIIALTLVCLMVFGLFSGCSKPADAPSKDGQTNTQASTKAEPDKKLKIAWINPLIGHPLYNMQDKGAKMAAEDYGVELSILGTPTIAPEGYVEAIENAIADKFDGIVVCPYNVASFTPVLKKVKDANIPVVTTIADVEPDLRISNIGLDLEAFGKLQAESLIEKTGGKANIVWMQSALDVDLQNAIRSNFEEALKSEPGMKILVTEGDQVDPNIAMQKFQDIFNAYPEIDTVVMCEAAGGASAAKVAKEMNREITILNIDDIDETLDGIRKGEMWATIAQNYVGIGYASVRLLAEKLRGEEVPDFVEVELILVTKDNVDTYKDDLTATMKKKGTPW